MNEKTFKTLDEQVNILKSRGLSIPDDASAKDFLYRNNYYRISGYSLTLRNHDVFYDKSEFQNIVDIYEFDHKLRHILLQYIESIEITVKSVYAYEFAKAYSSTGYLSNQYFTDSQEYLNIISKGRTQCAKSLGKC